MTIYPVTVYVVTRRGTLHKAVKLDPAAREVQTYEADNLDQAKGAYWSMVSEIPANLIKRSCRRCFPVTG